MRRADDPRTPRGALVRTFLVRLVIFAVAWWAIAEGRPVPWYFAAAGVLGASALSVALFPAGRWTLRGVLRFIPFFVVESTRGGIDVALRALRPGRHVHPGFIVHRFESEDPQVQLLVANATSLMPGTLAARLEGNTMVVHLLDTESPAVHVPDRVEARVTAMTRRR